MFLEGKQCCLNINFNIINIILFSEFSGGNEVTDFKNKIKIKVYHIVGTFPKSNRKILETYAKSISLRHI